MFLHLGEAAEAECLACDEPTGGEWWAGAAVDTEPPNASGPETMSI